MAEANTAEMAPGPESEPGAPKLISEDDLKRGQDRVQEITDRHINNDVGYDYRFGVYWDYGPKSIPLGNNRIFFAWMDSRDGNPETDTMGVYETALAPRLYVAPALVRMDLLERSATTDASRHLLRRDLTCEHVVLGLGPLLELGRRALDMPGDARQDLWIIQEIARRIGLDWSYQGPREVYDEMARATEMAAARCSLSQVLAVPEVL